MNSILIKKQVLILALYLITINLWPQTFTDSGISLPGVSNSSVAWGDYDNDGDLDILMTGSGISKIYRNDGDETFTEQTGISLAGVDYSAAAWGDYDNDGDLDILLTGGISKIYRNNGDNSFTEQTNISLISISQGSVNWGDYDNDGDQDILMSAGVPTKIYYNTGDNGFAALSVNTLMQVFRPSASTGDYDNDGDLDILLTGIGPPGRVTRLFRNENGYDFSEQTGISLLDLHDGAVAWGDYDCDGNLDILLTGNTGYPSGAISIIYHNNGNNSFTEQTSIQLKGVYNGSANWGDYDNNGYPDILITGYSISDIPISVIYRNNGDNTFTELTDISLPGVCNSSADWGDYDNDGDLDILLTGQTSSGIISKIFRNETVTSNIKPTLPTDLQAIVDNNKVTFTWGKSSDTETPQNGLSYNIYIYEAGQTIYECPPHAFRISDEKNGRRLIAKPGNIQWCSSGFTIKDLPPDKIYYWTAQAVDAGLQGGNFSNEMSFTIPFYKPVTQANSICLTNVQAATQATASWVSGGGTKRAVFINTSTLETADPSDNTTYYIGDFTPGGWKCVYNGTGNFTVLTGIIPNIDYSIHVCEYNGQFGNETYLTSTAPDNPLKFNLFLSEQTGIILPKVMWSSAAWGDYDNDGYLDILLAGCCTTTSVYHNNGDNTFSLLSGGFFTGVYYSSVAWGDYDNDGDLDILLSGHSGEQVTKIYKNNGDGSFTEQKDIKLTGTQSGSVDWGDYDNDGDLDILLTGKDYSNNPVSKIYRNNGDDSFSEQIGIILTGVYYSSAAWGDFDNDEDLDIILAGLNSSGIPVSKIYRNNNDNTFTEQTGIALTGVRNSSVVWGDYDNDGDIDLLLAGYTGATYISVIYRNNSDNTFTPQTDIGIQGVRNGSADWGDYDNDGDLDILLAGLSTSGFNVSTIYRNNGDNSFTELPFNEITGVSDGSICWGDYDNDGDLDVLLTGEYNSGGISKIYRNEIINPNIKPETLDGLQSCWDNNQIVLKWNPTSDNSTPEAAISYNLRIGTTPDGNEIRSAQALTDGKLLLRHINNLLRDTCYTLKLPFNRYYWTVQAVDNGGMAGNFAPEVTTPLDSIQARDLQAVKKSSTSMLIRWKNGNGARRALFGRYLSSEERAKPADGTIYLAEPYFGEGDQISTTGWYCLYNGKADSAIVYGLNEGYSYDLQVVEYIEDDGLPVYFNTVGNGNPGNFSTSVFSEQTSIIITGVWGSSVAWADYDNDGYLDILLTGTSQSSDRVTKIYKNNGDNTFSEQTGISLIGTHSGSVGWGDYDNDNDFDIILTGYTSTGNISKIYQNDNNHTFIDQTGISLPGVYQSSVSWGDYDNDNDLDILLTGATINSPLPGNPVSKIYLNNGNNTFTEQSDITLEGVFESSAAWGDYDNDGDLDILLTGSSNTGPVSKIYRNNGNNTFNEQTAIGLIGVQRSSVAWGDYDNDGDLDILKTGQTKSYPDKISKVYRNNGDGTFTVQSGITLLGVEYSSIAWGDYDNDGNLDILLAGFSNSGILTKIYRNSGNNSFIEQSNISIAGIYYGSVAWGDYDNDGDLDFILTGYTGSGFVSKIYRNNSIMKAGSFNPNSKPSASSELENIIAPGMVTLKWAPVTSDETPYKTMSYNLRYKLINASEWSYAPCSGDNGYRRIPVLGNIQLNKSFILKNLNTGDYVWQVQAVDQGYQGGNWSQPAYFTVKRIQAFFKTDTVCLSLSTAFTDQSVATDGITAWEWDFKDGSFSSLQNPVHAYSASGTYLVKLVIISATGDKDSLEQNVIVKARPTTSFEAPNVCEGTTTTITNTTNLNGLTISNWFWNFGDGQTSSVQQPETHTYSLKGTYQTKLKAIATNGCADSITKEIIVAAIPNSAVSVNGKTTFCQGDSVQLIAEYNPLYTYQWKLDNNDLINTDTSSYKVKLNSGAYSVKVTNTLASCISTSGQTNVTVNPIPVSPYISASGPTVFCQGDSVILSVTNTTGYTYQWKFNGGAVGIDSSQHTAKTSGIYSLTVSNASGCFANSTNTVPVIVNAKPTIPTINLSGQTTFCQGGSVDLSVTSNTAYNYQWQNNGLNISGATSSTHSAQNSGVYSLNILNSDGCSSKTENVAVNVLTIPSAPSISFSGDLQFCQGDSVVLSVVNTAGYTYQWKQNGGSVGSNQNSFTAKSSGNYTLTVSNSSGCSANSTNTVTVIINPRPTVPTVSISGQTTFCQGGSVSLSVVSNPAYTYLWQNNGSNISGATFNTYTAQNSGLYSLNILNSDGCSNKTENVTVNVLPAPSSPSISTNGSTTFCQDDSVVLSVTNTASYTCQWKQNSEAVGSDQSTFIAKSSGAYTITVTNPSGCATNSTNTVNVVVNPKPTIPTIGVNGSKSFCQGGSVDLSVSNNTEYTYHWQNNGSYISGATTNSYTASASGVYSLNISNSDGCSSKTENVTINVLTSPDAPSISASGPVQFCQGDSVVLSVTNTSGYTYQWTQNGGTVGSNQNTYTAKSSGDYILTVSNSTGCNANSTNTIKVIVIPKPTVPTVSISGQTSFCQGQNVVLSVSNNPAYAYQWQNNGSNISGATASTYTAQNSGLYSLNVLNSDGCSVKTENVTVNVLTTPSAPSISAGGPLQFCQGDSVVLSVTNTVGYTCQWKQNGGAVGYDQNTFKAKYSGDYTVTVSNSSGCNAISINTVKVVVNPKPAIPTVAVNGSKWFCQGGSVDLSVSNNIDFTYQWQDNGSDISNATSNTFNAKNSGVYSLNILNSYGCSGKTENVTINVLSSPDALSISASGRIQFCQGDSVTLSVTNTAGYTYQWKQNGGTVGNNSSQFVAKNSGTYNIVVSNANGCSVSSVNSIDVIVNPSPAAGNISLSGTATFCQGESVVLSVPSTTGYTYNWRNEDGVISGTGSTSYTATTSGKYQLDITNSSGCTVKTSPVNVTVKTSPYKPVLGSVNYEAGKCPGENIIRLNATQTIPEYQYQWYKDGMPLLNKILSALDLTEQGNYKLEADLGGCKAESDIFNINFPGAPEKPMIYAQGPTVWYLACSNTKASKYKWYCNDKLIEGADKYCYVANRKMGDFQVSIANEQGCYTKSDIVTIPTGATGISDIDPFEGLKVYPNPTTGMLTIEMENDLFGELLITIITEQGKEILNIKTKKTTEHFSGQIDLSGYSYGFYFVKLEIKKYSAIRKLIIE